MEKVVIIPNPSYDQTETNEEAPVPKDTAALNPEILVNQPKIANIEGTIKKMVPNQIPDLNQEVITKETPIPKEPVPPKSATLDTKPKSEAINVAMELAIKPNPSPDQRDNIEEAPMPTGTVLTPELPTNTPKTASIGVTIEEVVTE